eukprot:Selendium_serpulae@DN6108_c3_g1_i3.p1
MWTSLWQRVAGSAGEREGGDGSGRHTEPGDTGTSGKNDTLNFKAGLTLGGDEDVGRASGRLEGGSDGGGSGHIRHLNFGNFNFQNNDRDGDDLSGESHRSGRLTAESIGQTDESLKNNNNHN